MLETMELEKYHTRVAKTRDGLATQVDAGLKLIDVGGSSPTRVGHLANHANETRI